jgi:hypothetical protein
MSGIGGSVLARHSIRESGRSVNPAHLLYLTSIADEQRMHIPRLARRHLEKRLGKVGVQTFESQAEVYKGSIVNSSTSIHWRPGMFSRPQRSLPQGVATMYWLSSHNTRPIGPCGDGTSRIVPAWPET